jgi:hypothetical protein
VLVAVACLVDSTPRAATPAADDQGLTFGQALELDAATPIADLLARPHEFEGKLVQFKGAVKEVCAAMGCWLRIDAGAAGTLLARSGGDQVTIPTDSAGRQAIVEGIVVVEHDGESADGASEAGHTCPTAVVRLETRGVVLR